MSSHLSRTHFSPRTSTCPRTYSVSLESCADFRTIHYQTHGDHHDHDKADPHANDHDGYCHHVSDHGGYFRHDHDHGMVDRHGNDHGLILGEINHLLHPFYSASYYNIKTEKRKTTLECIWNIFNKTVTIVTNTNN